MIPVTTFAGRTVALFGLGGSGLATALALQAGEAKVVACDDDPARMAKAAGQGIETGDLRTADWARFSSLILSPGVPLTHPEPHWSAKLAQDAGVEVIGDIELFCRERERIAPDAPFVAITGTNGKSTTTALITHILREAGRDVQMGGNIGTAILWLDPPANDRVHVIECSSFQIDLAPSLKPTVGVLLNISPDHLDRHGTIERYATIKERLVSGAEVAVVGVDDERSKNIAEQLEGGHAFVVRISSQEPGREPADYNRTENHQIVRSREPLARVGQQVIGYGPSGPVADLQGTPALRGTHNAQNACAAAAVANTLGVSDASVASALRTFPGLPHRMEEVARRGRVIFVNDSKATNADSTDKALAAFDRVFWIAGGKAKAGGIAPLAPYFPRIEKAYLIGASTEDFAATLDGHVPSVRCGTLDRAVAQAAEDAARSDAPEPVVLLSPACASYDQYRNFEARGDHFRELVRALPGITVKDL